MPSYTTPWAGIDITLEDIVAATGTFTGVVSTGGVQIGSNDTDGVEWVGSVNTAKFYSDGTNLVMTKNGLAWITLIMSGGSPSVSTTGMLYGFYGMSAQTTVPATTHGGQWTTTAGKASTTDWEHNVDVVTNGTAAGEMARVWKTGSAKLIGISCDGAVCVWLTNNSGGALAEGDIVIHDVANASSVTTTTSAASVLVAGVCVTSAPANATGCWVAVQGIAKVAYTGTAPSIGDALETSTSAGDAQLTASPTAGATLGRALTAGAGGFVTALIGVR